MDKMKLLYKNDDGVCIVKLSENKYYYGNGETFGGIGVDPNQFLRFNPYMEYVGDKKETIPKPILERLKSNYA